MAQPDISDVLRRARPTCDSPTYLFISGRIDGEEWVQRVQASRARAGLPPIDNLRPPRHATPEEAARMGAVLRRMPKPTLDSPTYLLLSGKIDEDEYRRRLHERRRQSGLPPLG